MVGPPAQSSATLTALRPWFAATMSTGALAVVLYQTPNQFPGLKTIGKILFILDIVMFLVFNAVIATRFILVPKKLPASLHHPVEGLFYGSYWVSVSLILNCTQSYGVSVSGPWLVKALQVCFWIYCAVVFAVGVGQYYVLFQEERLNVADAMPAWIFPIYPLLVVGPMAGTMIPSQPREAAWEMWVAAVCLQGIAWVVSLMMYSIYTQRLMSSSLPSPSTRPGMYVSVGPAGYTAAGLISLGTQAPNVVPIDKWTSLDLPDGDLIKGLGILSGLFVILFAFWFFCISTVAVLSGIRHMSFTLNWWVRILIPCLLVFKVG
jgi:C4-dicarboxylate transporter/malic acid transport protein